MTSRRLLWIALLVLAACIGAYLIYQRFDTEASFAGTDSATALPRSGVITSVTGDTLTLDGEQGQFIVRVDDATIIRTPDDSGSYVDTSREALTVGRGATISLELPGDYPVGMIDVTEVGGAE